MRVFQNFRGRRRVFLGFFEGFLLALESLCLAVSASSFFPRFSVFLIFFDFFFFDFYFFTHFSIFRHRKIMENSLFDEKRPFLPTPGGNENVDANLLGGPCFGCFGSSLVHFR